MGIVLHERNEEIYCNNILIGRCLRGAETGGAAQTRTIIELWVLVLALIRLLPRPPPAAILNSTG